MFAHGKTTLRWIIAGAAIAIMTGCASFLPKPAPLPDYYILTAVPEAERSRPAGEMRAGPIVGVARVSLPDYLETPEIVVRTTRNTLDKASLHNWAAPLEDNFAGVLADNLGVMIPTVRVTTLPGELFFRPDVQVSVDVSKFERDVEGLVTLVARWALFGQDGQELIVTQRSVFQQPAPADNYDAIVAAMSTTLARLSAEIAAAIGSRRLPGV